MKPEERRGNDGCLENEENQTPVSLRFPEPLEIAARFPHSHRAGDEWFSNQKNKTPNQERSPAEHEPELHPFRLILGLENASLSVSVMLRHRTVAFRFARACVETDIHDGVLIELHLRTTGDHS
jgi:hypothetical protein